MIYLDNAATTYTKPQCVIDAVIDAMQGMGNSGRGGNLASLNASRLIFEARIEVAHFFHAASPNNVVFTANSTESLNVVINGLFHSGDHIITTEAEHNSVLRPLYHLEDSLGIELSFLKCNEKGNINISEISNLIQGNTKAIICTHASNLTGNVFDIEEIGKIAKKYNLFLIVDASQTAGIIPIDVKNMNIDILCFTGHKGIMGPQGTGGIIIKDGISIRPFKFGGTGISSYLKSQPDHLPTRLEAGTLNAHGIAGLLAAIKYINSIGIDTIHKKESDLMWHFYSSIKKMPKVTIYGDFQIQNRCAIISLNIDTHDSSLVSDILSTKYNIATRSGAHCAPLMHKALGTVNQGAVRFSFGYFNTLDEVNKTIEALKNICSQIL